LQRLKQSHVLGDIIVLVPDPFGNSDSAACGAADYEFTKVNVSSLTSFFS
jgi:hypothetical protein